MKLKKYIPRKREIQECKENLDLLKRSGAKNFTSELQNLNINEVNNALPDNFLQIWRVKRILSFLKLVESFKDIQKLTRD